MTALHHKLWRSWPILLPMLAMLLIFPWLPQVKSPNELCRLRQSQALVEDGTLEITQALKNHGWVGDLTCVAIRRDDAGNIAERRRCPETKGQKAFSERHYYPSKAPLLSLMAVPVVALSQVGARILTGRSLLSDDWLIYLARLVCTVLPAILVLIPLRRFLRRKLRRLMGCDAKKTEALTASSQAPDHLADALTATFALGTLAFSYAELFMSHGLTGTLVLLTFFALDKASRSSPTSHRWVGLAGLLASLTVAAEYTGALPLIPLAIYGLSVIPGGTRSKIRGAIWGILGALPGALAIATYHWHLFGHPFTSPYLFLNDAAYQGWHTGGFLGIGLPNLRAFILSFFSPLRGLFTLSPALLLGIFGLILGLTKIQVRRAVGRELILSGSILILYAYFTSSFTYDSWGWTTGPRHLTPLCGFLLLPMAVLISWAIQTRRLSQRLREVFLGLISGLCAMSILTTSAMTLINYIPDQLTNGPRQLVYPLLFQGFLPHSPLSMLGVSNPWAALPALVSIVLTAILTARAILCPVPQFSEADQPSESGRSLAKTRRWIGGAACLVTCVITLALQMAATPNSPKAQARDEATVHFLQTHFDPPPGQASRF